MERERNGAPISAEVTARMTKPKDEELYQVWVEPKGSPTPIPVAPRMVKGACEALIEAINRQITLGAEKVWGNPHIVRCQIIS